MNELKNYLAVDIGGSKLLVGIVTSDGEILAEEKHILGKGSDENFLIDKICELSRKLEKYTPVAAGVTIPGLADSENGLWVYAPFSGIHNFPIAKLLKDKLGIPVFVENDVNCCALAEKKYGECKDDNDFLWITVSNGIGGALWLDGKLYSGTAMNAGEIGHFIIEENCKEKCGCGKYGCLEAVASGSAISRRYNDLTGESVSTKEIADLYVKGDKNAQLVYNSAAEYIGKALSYVINILNLQKIIIGGGVSESFGIMEEKMIKSVEKYTFTAANKKIEILKSRLGYNAALIGCTVLCEKGCKK